MDDVLDYDFKHRLFCSPRDLVGKVTRRMAREAFKGVWLQSTKLWARPTPKRSCAGVLTCIFPFTYLTFTWTDSELGQGIGARYNWLFFLTRLVSALEKAVTSSHTCCCRPRQTGGPDVGVRSQREGGRECFLWQKCWCLSAALAKLLSWIHTSFPCWPTDLMLDLSSILSSYF